MRAHVGRQAIFDRELRVVGYELLYRSSEANRAEFTDVDRAVATTMLSAYLELGLDHLAGDRPVFVNLAASYLLGDYPIVLPPERTVIEVLEDVPVSRALLVALADLRAQGFGIALDDFVPGKEGTRPLVELADVIKLDVLGLDADTIRARHAAVRGPGRRVLAEKIETREMMELVHELGFDLFQGYFLEVPVVERRERMPHNRAALVRLLARLYDPKVDIRQVEKLLAAEVGLTVPLLRLARSAAFTGSVQIGTIAEAVSRLGTQQVAALVMLTIVADFDDKPIELAREALMRARMCEVLARGTNVPPGELFTAGLLSLLGALIDMPLEEILERLPVTDTIREALQVRRSPAGRIVEAARGQAHADFELVDATGLPPNATFVAWYDAIRWTDELMATLT